MAHEELNTLTMERYLAYLRERVSSTSVNTYYRALKTFFTHLSTRALIDENPMDKIQTPKIPKTSPEILTETEMGMLFKAAKDNKRNGVRDYALVMFLFETGARAGEIAKLKVKDVDFSNKSARVLGKGSKSRTVFFRESTKAALLSLLAERDISSGNQYLFYSERGESLSISGQRQIVKRVAKRAGIKDKRIYTHLLRHNFGTFFIKNGGGESALMGLLGHTTTTTTKIYVHLVETDLQGAHEKYSPMHRIAGMEM
jgi:site-specific recombinase XerD